MEVSVNTAETDRIDIYAEVIAMRYTIKQIVLCFCISLQKHILAVAMFLQSTKSTAKHA